MLFIMNISAGKLADVTVTEGMRQLMCSHKSKALAYREV